MPHKKQVQIVKSSEDILKDSMIDRKKDETLGIVAIMKQTTKFVSIIPDLKSLPRHIRKRKWNCNLQMNTKVKIRLGKPYREF